MRTTVILPDELYRQVKERLHGEGRTFTSFLEEALRRELARRPADMGAVDIFLAPPSGSREDQPLVDLSDKDAVQAILDEDDFAVRQILGSQVPRSTESTAT